MSKKMTTLNFKFFLASVRSDKLILKESLWHPTDDKAFPFVVVVNLSGVLPLEMSELLTDDFYTEVRTQAEKFLGQSPGWDQDGTQGWFVKE